MEYDTLENLTLSDKTRLLTGGGYWTTAEIKKAKIRAVRFSDGPAGLRPQGDKGDNLGSNKSYPATCFPAHSALACSWNKNLVYEVAKRIGEEAASYSVDVVLAPALNLKRSPLCGRNFEYFSEDAYLNGRLGALYVCGLQSTGAGACVKHFAANNREFGRMVCDSVVDERTLRELYLTSFEIAVKEGKPAAVMTAYNRLNGVYCNQSGYLINDILRGEWGFDGAVISDWGGTYERAASVKAGADLEMPPCIFSPEEVERAVREGVIDESSVDSCAERIIKLAARERERVGCDFSEHARFAEAAARECAVLLKNDGVLPLGGGKTVIIGEAAQDPIIQGGGSSKVNPKKTLSLCGQLKGFEYERGYSFGGESKRLAKRALKLSKGADTVIFCAGHKEDCEGADREGLDLPANQIKLLKSIIALNKKVVVVLFCGSAVNTDWDGGVNALLFAGLGGQSGAAAVADILTGAVNPSGKLCESFPLSDGVEAFKDPYAEIYGEGMQTGYLSPQAVKYPFGFGLSYTKFTYSGLQISESGASFEITNDGAVGGSEAAQMYLRFPEKAHSPDIMLKGFEKVFLDAGERKRVFIPFDEYTFRSYDTALKKWTEVKGRYTVLIGCSSADMKLEAYIDREGAEAVPAPQTDGLKPAAYTIKRTKKGRVIADYSIPLCELKNAKGLFGRLFAGIILRIVKNNRTVFGSMQYLPLRTMGQFGKMSKNTLDGLILMFNGKFFKGLARILFKRKQEKI